MAGKADKAQIAAARALQIERGGDERVTAWVTLQVQGTDQRPKRAVTVVEGVENLALALGKELCKTLPFRQTKGQRQ